MKKCIALSIIFLVFTMHCMEQKEEPIKSSPLPHLNVAVFLDAGDEDGKGGVFTDLAGAIRDKVPVIASSYLIKILIDNRVRENYLPIKTLFAELLDADQWSLFRNTLSDFVVALPNNFWPHLGKINKEKLTLIGLNKDALTQIPADTFEDIFKNALAVPINMDSLENLFLINPNIRKRIYLSGHGYFDERMRGGASDASIANLTIPQYQRFLHFLNTIGTDILYVDSCYSGGLHLLTPYLKKVDTASKQLLNYFIIIAGLTDAATIASYDSSNYKKFFDAIDKFFMPQGKPIKNPFHSIVTHKWGGYSNNIPSVRFPGGINYFKAIDVDGKIAIITQAKITAKILEEKKGLKRVTAETLKKERKPRQRPKLSERALSKIDELSVQIKEKQEKGEDVAALGKKLEEQLKQLKESSQKREDFLEIQNKKALLLYPLMIPAFLSIHGSMPNIISMIPGNAIHYIDTISTWKLIDTFFLSFYNL